MPVFPGSFFTKIFSTMTRKTIPMPEDVKAENKMWVGRKIRKYFGKHGWHVGECEP